MAHQPSEQHCGKLFDLGVKKRKMKFLFVAFSLLLFASCTTAKQAQEKITENKWQIVEVNGRKVNAADTFMRPARILFLTEENRISASAGCNLINGRYSINSKGKISFSQMIATKMACPDMKLEDALLKSLHRIDAFRVENDMLILSEGTNDLIKLFPTTE